MTSTKKEILINKVERAIERITETMNMYKDGNIEGENFLIEMSKANFQFESAKSELEKQEEWLIKIKEEA